MLRFTKKEVVVTMKFFNFNTLNVSLLRCV